MSTSGEAASGSSTATASEREVLVERVFNAPREDVWRAFTEPELLAQWWGRGNKLEIEKLELRTGGAWRFVEHAEDGVHGFEGHYREVNPPETLAWTFAWDGMTGHPVLDTVTFADLGDGRTRVLSRSLFQSTEERDAMIGLGMEKGRNRSYAALDRLLASATAAEGGR